MSFDFKKITKFEHNLGDKEKQYRLYGGAVLTAISVFIGEPFMLIIGMVLIATGYSGWCPIYSGLGKNTCVAAAPAAPAAPAATKAAAEKPASKAKSKK